MRFVTILGALCLLAVLATVYYDVRTRRDAGVSFDALLLMTKVRHLQETTRLFISEARPVEESLREWDDSRKEFMEYYERVRPSFLGDDATLALMERALQTVSQADALNQAIHENAALLSQRSLAADLARQGLHACHQRLLEDAEAPAQDLSLSGLTLFTLWEYNRRMASVEQDLRHLVTEFQGQASRKLLLLRVTFALALFAALLGCLYMVRKLLGLHARVADELAMRTGAERRASASEADLRSLLDGIAEAVIATDRAGLVTRMNPVAERLTGWTEREASGLSLSRVFCGSHALTGSPMPNPVESVVSSGLLFRSEVHYLLMSRCGIERLIEWEASPLSDSGAETRGVAIVFRDITEPARLEERIRAQVGTEAAAKLAAGVAHEVNNVLQIVRANLSFAMDPRSTPDDFRECLTQMDTASKRGAELTRKLLIYSRKHPIRLGEAELPRFMESAEPSLRRTLGTRIELELQVPEELPLVRIDARLLELALCNLCENARDAMPAGGRVSVEVSTCRFLPEEVEAYAWARPGTFVQIIVSDNGAGMSPEVLQRCLEPFFSTKNMAVASGLGLSVVQGILLQHDGLLHVFSEEGRGTTIGLFLPVTDAPLAVAKAPTEVQAEKRLRVLVADDDPHLRNMLAGALRHRGHEVLVASDGDDACKLVLASKVPLDVLVLDLVMPRMGGAEAARNVLAMRPGAKVILCTGHGKGPLRDHPALDAGWVLLHKPISHRSLIQEVENGFNTAAPDLA